MITELYNFNLVFQTSTKSDLQTQGVVHGRRDQWSEADGVAFPSGHPGQLIGTVLTKSEVEKRKGTWIASKLTIGPGRTQVPELNLISYTRVYSGEHLNQSVERLLPLLPQLSSTHWVSAGAQEAGCLRLSPSPSFTSGSTPSFPFQVVCPG